MNERNMLARLDDLETLVVDLARQTTPCSEAARAAFARLMGKATAARARTAPSSPAATAVASMPTQHSPEERVFIESAINVVGTATADAISEVLEAAAKARDAHDRVEVMRTQGAEADALTAAEAEAHALAETARELAEAFEAKTATLASESKSANPASGM